MIYNQVYPLADALQLDIRIYKDAKDYELRGEREFSLPMSKGTDLKVKVSVEASVIDADRSGILVKVVKNFWVFLAFDSTVGQDGELTLHYLDMERTKLKAVKDAVNTADFEAALMAIKPLTKRTYKKTPKVVDWAIVHPQINIIRKADKS